MRKDIFISYSSLDKDFVRKLAGDLKSRNVEVWLDEWDIRPGANIVKEIDAGLKHSRYLLVIVSENSLKSKWVAEEWTNKFGEEVKKGEIMVIPTVLGDVTEDDIPTILLGKKRINLSTDYQAEIENFAEYLVKQKKEDIEQRVVAELKNLHSGGLKPRDRLKEISDQTLSKLKKRENWDSSQKINLILRETEFEYTLANEEVEEVRGKINKNPTEFDHWRLIFVENVFSEIERFKRKMEFISKQTKNEELIVEELILELECASEREA